MTSPKGGTNVYRAAAGKARWELREKGSRFVAIVEPASDESSVRDQIKAYQQEYSDATHVCWAWRIGSPAREGRSDAGEPSGTAGTPMLRLLQGNDLSDVLAVVVRWFGGVKLGKGGLARAYAGAVREAVGLLSITERRPVKKLRVSLPYERVGDLKRLVHPPSVEILAETYGDTVTVTLGIDRDQAGQVEEALKAFATQVENAGTQQR